MNSYYTKIPYSCYELCMHNVIQILRLFHNNKLLVLIFGKSGGKIEWMFYFCFLGLNKTNVLRLIQAF